MSWTGTDVPAKQPLPGQLRATLATRLRERRGEIEAVALARVQAISDPVEVEDPQYAIGLRAAVAPALEFGIAGVEAGDSDPPAIPEPLLAQARAAARNGVSLDTVLRRYFAGNTLLVDFLIEEVEREESVARADLKDAIRSEAIAFDGLVSAISRAYSQEIEESAKGTEERRAKRVRMLLAGELLDAAELGYEFDAWHVGAVTSGPGVLGAIRALASATAAELLLIRPRTQSVWAWLGWQHRVSSREVLHLAESRWPADCALSLGEPGHGLDGWRLTHRQANAGISVALRLRPHVVSHADVALLAAALRDEVLAGSLRSAFLAPLEAEKDGGSALIETLHAYFGAGRNVSSAAASLGVSRKTVTIRLRSAEEQIGRSLASCALELETALSLRELNSDHNANGVNHTVKSPIHVDHGVGVDWLRG